ncbi:MAG: nucleotide exchange factor GrpE [Oscillospiraceae bacterium]|nr:nucleotide exchange factor GrpE [Oscillospiraceae bacterium]
MAKSNKKKESEIEKETEKAIENETVGTEVEAENAEQPKEIDEVAALKDQLLRQAAEYDNYRKRTAKERLELVPEITADTVAKILPVIDNIERALLAECSDENYKKGIEMISVSFAETLKSLGVEEITDEDFDPSVHQAVQNVESDTLESGKVAEVFQKGYKIGSRVIRFAMVAIVK